MEGYPFCFHPASLISMSSIKYPYLNYVLYNTFVMNLVADILLQNACVPHISSTVIWENKLYVLFCSVREQGSPQRVIACRSLHALRIALCFATFLTTRDMPFPVMRHPFFLLRPWQFINQYWPILHRYVYCGYNGSLMSISNRASVE